MQRISRCQKPKFVQNREDYCLPIMGITVVMLSDPLYNLSFVYFTWLGLLRTFLFPMLLLCIKPTYYWLLRDKWIGFNIKKIGIISLFFIIERIIRKYICKNSIIIIIYYALVILNISIKVLFYLFNLLCFSIFFIIPLYLLWIS